MERYLLFDSGCSLCTSIARRVEEASEGKLIARSLRDPDVRSILDETKPGWRWEPMLLEVDGERRRVYAGVGMRARLVQVLGLRQALTVAQAGQATVVFQSARRRFLQVVMKTVGVLATVSSSTLLFEMKEALAYTTCQCNYSNDTPNALISCKILSSFSNYQLPHIVPLS